MVAMFSPERMFLRGRTNLNKLTPPDHEVGYLRIAVAGNPGSTVAEHFGQAQAFNIFEVGPEGPRFVGERPIIEDAGEDRRQAIARILADCDGLLVSRIGPVPKEKMAAAGIDATADYADQPVEAALAAYRTARFGSPEASEIAPDATQPGADFGQDPDFGRFRLVHTMLRVRDMDRSIDFYTRLLGMRVIEQRDHRKNQFTQTYLGHDGKDAAPCLELVFNWMRDEPYEVGEAFGHIAIAVNGIWSLCRRLEAEGVPMPRPPHSQRHGQTIVAFIEDPDGHPIELIQAPSGPA